MHVETLKGLETAGFNRTRASTLFVRLLPTPPNIEIEEVAGLHVRFGSSTVNSRDKRAEVQVPTARERSEKRPRRGSRSPLLLRFSFGAATVASY